MSKRVKSEQSLSQFDVICRAIVAAIAEEQTLDAHQINSISKRLGVSESSLIATLGTAYDLQSLRSTDKNITSVFISASSRSSVPLSDQSSKCYYICVGEDVGVVLNSDLVCRRHGSTAAAEMLSLASSIARSLKIGVKEVHVKPWDGWTWRELIDSRLEFAERQLDLKSIASH